MIRRYMAVLCISVLAGSSIDALAQGGPVAGMPSKMALSIPEAIELARRNNISSLRVQDNLGQAQATRKGARQLYLPNISWSGSFSKANQASEFRSNAGNFFSDKSYGMQASINQTIFDGFNLLHTPKARSLDVKSSEQAVKGNRQSIAYDAKRLCYDLLRAQKLADVQDRAVKRAEEQLETSKARFDLGSASMSDFLKSKVQLGRDSLDLIKRQNDIEVARATLNDFLGLSVDRNTEIDGEFGFEEYTMPNAPARKAAIESHPDVMSASYSSQAAGHDVGGAQSDRWPSVSAFAQYNWSAPKFPESNSDIFDTDRHSVGLSFNYTIFSGYRTSSNIQRAKISQHTREAELVQARRTIDLALKTAALNVDVARKSYRLSEQQVRSAQEDLNIAQEKYNLGAATILDILTTQESLSSAETDKVQAVFDYNLSVAALEKAMGKGE